MTTDVHALAKEWLRLDRNPATRKEIEDLVAANNTAELAKRLSSRIEFGTAGLRAEMCAGFSRMNDLTVIQATQGLVQYVLKTKNGDASACSVVLGFDHRCNSANGLTSARFARLTAGVFLSKGIKVYFYPNLVHTPMVPFGITHLGASCGIMITASHNPKADNGYKLYWGNGSQIVPPMDAHIAQSIEDNLEPWVWDETLIDTALAQGSPLAEDPTAKVTEAYMAMIAKLGETVKLREPMANGVKICYTAMHGVGFPWIRRAFDAAGLPPFFITPEQVHPDPEFPTVAFPNPEEGQGALSLAMAAADSHGCRIILANDPDADRLAVAEKQPSGQWHIFTGNQIGIMLAAFLLPGFKRTHPGKKFAVLTTTVSSMMIKQFAKVEGLAFEETLTGFKYLGNCGMAMVDRGDADLVMFAFEQAIGFMCGPAVMDKDGVSAGVCLGELAHWLATQTDANHPKTLFEWLQHLYVKYGFFASNDHYVVEHDKKKVDAMFDKIRPKDALEANEDWSAVIAGTKPAPAYPTTLADFEVVSVRDCTAGWDSTTKDHRPVLPTSRAAHMITFTFNVPERLRAVDANVQLMPCSMTLRTSGTEPKVKYYTELAGVWVGDQGVSNAEKIEAIKKVADAALADLVMHTKEKWLVA
ncbi:phosphoglucomutase [Catenaria anguillulae PL171]|uniref:Phosphoglucomutase n=1 Tax=Catenaria anguillulae PL171 TaxID=765915 RepID=A0A1Y2HA70_9FUNG|nr:phosphoglucomutase [Catenaria anguillulae PL171]